MEEYNSLLFNIFFNYIIALFLLQNKFILIIFLHLFLMRIIGKNNELYNGYALSLRSSQGWLMNYLDYKIYLKPFVPLRY